MKSDRVYLHHILDMIKRVESATCEGKSSFLASQLHQDAILRNLHTRTETTRRLSDDLKSEHPEVDWAKLATFRNVLFHDYLGIDQELVWTVVTRDVPALKTKVTKILGSLE
jgi:uncharacterized protein with HEPN domain